MHNIVTERGSDNGKNISRDICSYEEKRLRVTRSRVPG